MLNRRHQNEITAHFIFSSTKDPRLKPSKSNKKDRSLFPSYSSLELQTLSLPLPPSLFAHNSNQQPNLKSVLLLPAWTDAFRSFFQLVLDSLHLPIEIKGEEIHCTSSDETDQNLKIKIKAHHLHFINLLLLLRRFLRRISSFLSTTTLHLLHKLDELAELGRTRIEGGRCYPREDQEGVCFGSE